MNAQEDGVEERTWWPVVTIPLEEWQVDERTVLPISRGSVAKATLAVSEPDHRNGERPTSIWDRVRTMKFANVLAVVAVIALLAGCERKIDTASQAPEKPTASDVKQQKKEAADTSAAYLAKSKDEFLAAADRKMKDLDAKIDDLGKKSEGLKDDAKVQADKSLAELRERRATAGKKYDELKTASKDGWDRTKDGFASAWGEVEKTYENVRAKYF